MKGVIAIALLLYIETQSFAQDIDSLKMAQEFVQLINLNRALVSRQAFDSALNVVEKAEDLSLKAFGDKSLQYARALFNHGRTFQNQGVNNKGLPLYIRSIELFKALNQVNTIEFTSVLVNLANIYNDMNDFNKAEENINEAIKIRSGFLTIESPEIISAQYTLGNIFLRAEKYAKADSVFKIVKSFREKNKNSNLDGYRSILNNLGVTSFHLGKYDLAIQYQTECLEYIEKLYGKQNEVWSTTINNLGWYYQVKGDLNKAEMMYLQIMKIPGNPKYVKTELNLGQIYISTNRYIDAELMTQNAIHRLNTIKNVDSIDFIRLLNQLASAQVSQGKLKQSEQNYLQAKEICFRILGKGDLYSTILNNLGEFYIRIHNNRKAEQYLNECVTVHIERDEINSLSYSKVANNLGIALLGQGKLLDAKMWLMKALDLKNSFEELPTDSYIISLQYLMSIYNDLNQFDSARIMYNRANEIITKSAPLYLNKRPELLNILGNTFMAQKLYDSATFYFNSALILSDYKSIAYLDNLANSQIKLKKFSQAAASYGELLKLIPHRLYNIKTFLSEAEQGLYQQSIQTWLTDAIGFLSDHLEFGDELSSLCLENLLQHKAFLLENQIYLKAMSIKDTTLSGQYFDWLAIKRKLAEAYIDDSHGTTSDISILEERANSMEKAISRFLPEQGSSLDSFIFKLKHKLKQDEIILDFVKYQKEIENNKFIDSYGVFITFSNSLSSKIEFVPLCKGIDLNNFIQKSNSSRPDHFENIYSGTINSNSLYKLTWSKIDSIISKFMIRTIYISPSGLLNQINFDAISNDNLFTFLADKYKIIRILNTKSLIPVHKINESSSYSSIYAYGGITYKDYYRDNHHSKITQTNNLDSVIDINPFLLSRSNFVDYLPGTVKEVKIIKNLAKTKKIYFTDVLGNNATEESIKLLGDGKLKSPDIVHIGTHGFFLPNDNVGFPFRRDDETTINLNNPLFRSGILFYRDSLNAYPYKEDGILTAYEASLLHFSNTKLLTLSACETGLGQIEGNEGVYGLQRAFILAGVKNLVMSLWKVDDAITEKLMTQFYTNLILKGVSVNDALNLAQKSIRNTKNKEGLYPFRNPYYWAGFIALSN